MCCMYVYVCANHGPTNRPLFSRFLLALAHIHLRQNMLLPLLSSLLSLATRYLTERVTDRQSHRVARVGILIETTKAQVVRVQGSFMKGFILRSWHLKGDHKSGLHKQCLV